MRVLRQQHHAHALFTCRKSMCVRRDTLQNCAIVWLGEEELLNKVVLFVFFAHKKYSRSFIKLSLKHWCHMDYFNDVLSRDGHFPKILHSNIWAHKKINIRLFKGVLLCFSLLNLVSVQCVCLGIKRSTKLQISKSTPKGDILFLKNPFSRTTTNGSFGLQRCFLVFVISQSGPLEYH